MLMAAWGIRPIPNWGLNSARDRTTYTLAILKERRCVSPVLGVAKTCFF
jgi:hypothetical protein